MFSVEPIFQYPLIILNFFFIWMYPHPDLVNPLLSLDFWLQPPPPWALALELGVGWLPASTFRLLRMISGLPLLSLAQRSILSPEATVSTYLPSFIQEAWGKVYVSLDVKSRSEGAFWNCRNELPERVEGRGWLWETRGGEVVILSFLYRLLCSRWFWKYHSWTISWQSTLLVVKRSIFKTLNQANQIRNFGLLHDMVDNA